MARRPSTAHPIGDSSHQPQQERDWRFWILFPTLCVSGFVVTMDGTIMVTAIPTIARAFQTTQYTWIVNSYTLASTILQPLTGQLAEIFDRLPVLLASIVFFGIGSVIGGVAPSLAILLLGRTIQGIGGGSIPLMAEIIISDSVPVSERPKFIAMVMATSSFGLVLGPVIGGTILSHTTWRWIFYLNYPVVGVALLCLIPARGRLKRRTAHLGESWMIKLRRIDYIGNVLFSASALAILLPLTMGGNEFSWSSWHIIVSLALGVFGFVMFGLHEQFTTGRSDQLLPPRLLSTPILISLQVQSFIQSMVLIWVNYFLMVYFQAVVEQSPQRAGIDLLPTIVAIIVFALVGGMMASRLKAVIYLHAFAFAIMAVGLGLFTILDASSSIVVRVVLQIIVASGNGLLLPTLLPALQAQLPASDIWAITSLFSFIRTFAMVWGVTIPSIIFDQEVNNHIAQVPNGEVQRQLINGGAYTHASQSFIQSLSGIVKDRVVSLYVLSLRATWWGALGFVLLGLVFVGLELPWSVSGRNYFSPSVEDGENEGSHPRAHSEEK